MKHLENLLKLIIIGILTALFRAYGQGFIPVVEEPLLWPSIFADGGITTLAFMVFGSIFYTGIAALFLLMNKNMKGNKFIKGLRFSFFLILIWTAYLLEPLPHITLTDKIAYPLVEGGTLLLLGILAGALLGTSNGKSKEGEEIAIHGKVEDEENSSEIVLIIDNILSLQEEELQKSEALVSGNKSDSGESQEKNSSKKWQNIRIKSRIARISPLNIIIIGLFFFLGRIAMYKFLGIYSYFGTHALETLLWALITGLVIGLVFELTSPYICVQRWYLRFLVFGTVYLAVILIGFNGFKPLVYRRDTVDLALRTIGDCVSVILATGVCLSFDFKKNLKEELKKKNY